MPLGPRIANWPLRTKLLAVVMATTTTALLLAGFGIIVSDALLFNRYLERDLTALAQIIADNSTGALAFDDQKTAAETLGALKARTHLIAACIYKRDGTPMAKYSRPGTVLPCPPPSPVASIEFLPQAVSVVRPVMLSNASLGTLTMTYGYGEIGERRTVYGSTVALILLVSSLLAGLLSTRLRDMIADPVSRLVRTVTSVSASRNYSLRADKVSNDEMGVLVDAFNEMLTRIQARDEELREALDEREKANQRLAQSNADLERFAFVASHDLQEPLRMVTVYTQLLQRRSLLDGRPETADFVNNIVSGTRRMHELLDDLRAYAEIRAEADLTPVDLNRSFLKATANLKLAVETSGAEVTCDHLPSIRAYEGHFVAMFQNLIGNAIKYRSDKAPRIRVTCKHEGDTLCFAVSDNGIGIAPEYQSKIFVPFKRLHGAEIPGSGIGLAICQRVVERYGGRIWVQSQLHQGATFFFTLPDTVLADNLDYERNTA